MLPVSRSTTPPLGETKKEKPEDPLLQQCSEEYCPPPVSIHRNADAILAEALKELELSKSLTPDTSFLGELSFCRLYQLLKPLPPEKLDQIGQILSAEWNKYIPTNPLELQLKILSNSMEFQQTPRMLELNESLERDFPLLMEKKEKLIRSNPNIKEQIKQTEATGGNLPENVYQIMEEMENLEKTISAEDQKALEEDPRPRELEELIMIQAYLTKGERAAFAKFQESTIINNLSAEELTNLLVALASKDLPIDEEIELD